ncbi:NYN domain-containing protein [Silicimonas sp. MF1-12-2]|uniref:NYN domain-containing protein n=1 Tax=Silicimonas sp. MF1-12-2 TaxID=3384793 RepID=UPI0039B3A0C6
MIFFSSVALLVDGDNISSQLAGQILRRTADLGPHQIRRVYCNCYSVGSWSSASSFRTILSGSGKNGSDLVLSIEAMTFALLDNVPAFAIASSDRDFSHLAHALREMGRHVVGLGEEKTPKDFRHACSKFIPLTPPVAKVAEAELSELDRQIRDAILEMQQVKTGALVTRLNEVMRTRFQVMISKEKERKWAKYLKERPNLYALSGEGKELRVSVASGTDDS